MYAYSLSFIPVDLVVRKHGEVFQLKLQSRYFRSADEPSVILVGHADAFCEVDHGKWQPCRRLEGGHHTICQVLRTFEIDGIFRDVESR